ncbi:MAG: hypothetical protein A2901_04915 [Elusimicrobia bacterium RIFCSPLOWO2_01_FULL_54_10]|nr:MAG: hypothetical protein A2901_04915 [Elusimicrobia bacterium RIFCSPLOWO2_01_FULL_54_10]
MAARADLWFKEHLTPNETHSHRLKKILVKKKTKFQSAMIADTYSFGRCLILDGELQSAESDEFIYHEALIHPAFVTHPNPRRAVILGGGEGATLREILKHNTVTKATMVDIDGEVVDWCKKHMTSWHQGAFDRPRADVVIDDAKKYLEETSEKFDVIVSDLPSPVEAGPAQELYTVEFYRKLAQQLSPDGIFVLQAGSGSLLQIGLHLKLSSTLRKVFPIVRSYSTHIPSFDVPWAFLLCAQSPAQDPLRLTAGETEKRLRARGVRPLSFYDGSTHEGLFRIPLHLRKMLDAEKGVISEGKPVYLFR